MRTLSETKRLFPPFLLLPSNHVKRFRRGIITLTKFHHSTTTRRWLLRLKRRERERDHMMLLLLLLRDIIALRRVYEWKLDFSPFLPFVFQFGSCCCCFSSYFHSWVLTPHWTYSVPHKNEKKRRRGNKNSGLIWTASFISLLISQAQCYSAFEVFQVKK